MNAAIAVDSRAVAEVFDERETDVATESDASEVAPTTRSAPTFGSVMAVSVPLAMIAVFVLTTASMTAYRGDFLGAMGVAAYLAIWIGLGFGFIFGGAVWAMRQPHD